MSPDHFPTLRRTLYWLFLFMLSEQYKTILLSFKGGGWDEHYVSFNLSDVSFCLGDCFQTVQQKYVHSSDKLIRAWLWLSTSLHFSWVPSSVRMCDLLKNYQRLSIIISTTTPMIMTMILLLIIIKSASFSPLSISNKYCYTKMHYNLNSRGQKTEIYGKQREILLEYQPKPCWIYVQWLSLLW